MITYSEDEKVKVAILERAKPGNTCCGDAHIVIHGEDYTVCAVVDGLGSGEMARQSASAVTETIQAFHSQSVEQIVEACNQEMLYKRGVVMTIIKINYSKQKVCYANMGNIHFVMYLPDGKTVKPIPARGFLSGKKQTIANHTFYYKRNSTFSLYSDGVITPPSKAALMNMNSPQKDAKDLFPKNGYAIDDVTLLIGKIY